MRSLVWNMEELFQKRKLLVLAVLWVFCLVVFVFSNVYLTQVIVFKVSYVSLLSPLV